MTPDKIIVIIVGLVAIVAVYWFFFKRPKKAVATHGLVDIVVDGGYTPEIITVPRGKKTTIVFTRKDPTSCLEEVVLGDFKIRRELPLNQKVSVDITPERSGEYAYSCGMNMYHGKIIVE